MAGSRPRRPYAYAGSRHRMPYRNSIAHAAVVIDALERWFPEYAARHTDGLVAPQGIVSSVEGGRPRTSASPVFGHRR
ncbi:hypothetical protein TPA0910_00360 [Streptomyces hygroscopicus subsp. sporocinereus]|uniref:Uncharacterized protein n=1 Tax=Streptomyces hygroscopicus TaxID=1912 RepID=A0ABQ3TQT1_STRHY|nr:hypothetical protein [Streptomyces hygroscopicus]GHJ25603.1 hypothetical protein TPA0910_00360 [Streptomyces hygroscopicus]